MTTHRTDPGVKYTIELSGEQLERLVSIANRANYAQWRLDKVKEAVGMESPTAPQKRDRRREEKADANLMKHIDYQWLDQWYAARQKAEALVASLTPEGAQS